MIKHSLLTVVLCSCCVLACCLGAIAAEPEELLREKVRGDLMQNAGPVEEFLQKAREDIATGMNKAMADGTVNREDMTSVQAALAPLAKKILDQAMTIRPTLTEPEYRLKLDTEMLSLIVQTGKGDDAVAVIDRWKGDVREMLIAKAGQEFQMLKIPFSKSFETLLVELASSKDPTLAALGIRLTDPFFRDPIGKPFPAFPAGTKTLDGQPLTLERFQGKVLLVDFWATWCPPCVQTVPGLVAAYNKFRDKGFEIVGISFDEEKDKLDAFIKDNAMPWPQYYDGKGWQNEVGTVYGIQSIPAMYLLDKSGNVVATDLHGNLLEKELEKLLAQ